MRDEKDSALANVSIDLDRYPDSAVIGKAITDKNGIFKFDHILPGSYFIMVNSMGFLPKKTLKFTIGSNASSPDSLQIKLTRDVAVMRNVVVTSRKPLVENKIDRTVVNVDAFINNTGSSLLEVLGSAPNVDVDINGNISVKGKQGVLLYVDGKPSYLNGAALVNYLNSIPASQADQIEIMTQPSSKYDAAGNAGIINIRMKKNKQTGLNINLSTSYMQGFYARTLNSLVVNYKIDKWNFFASADVNYLQRYTHRHLSRFLSDTSQNTAYFQDQFDVSTTPDHSLLAGADYFLNKTVTIGLVMSSRASAQRNEVTDHSNFNDLDRNGKIISYLTGLNMISNPWVNNSAGLNIRKTIDKTSEMTTDVNYEYFHFRSHQSSSDYSYDSAGNLQISDMNPYLQRSVFPSSINILTAKLDYSKSYKNLTIESGVKTAFVRSANNASFYFMRHDSLVTDLNLTNFYNYRENINATYINLHRQFKHWEVQTGLRLEETNTSGLQKVSSERFNRSYAQLFPTVFIGYAPDDKNNWSLSFGRRIDRPNYSDLNPFSYLIDQYTYRKGNPDLKPFFSNYVELDYNYRGKFGADLDYGIAKGIVNNTLKLNDSTNILIQMPANVSSLTTVAFNLRYNSPIKKWSVISLSYSLFNNHYRGSSDNLSFDREATTSLINITQQFLFRHGWSAEWNVFYRSRFLLTALAWRGPRKVSSIGFGKTIMKGRGSIKMKITDPLKIQTSYGGSDLGNIHTTIKFGEDSRRVGITFTYRFQKGLKTSARKFYSPEEKSRINLN